MRFLFIRHFFLSRASGLSENNAGRSIYSFIQMKITETAILPSARYTTKCREPHDVARIITSLTYGKYGNRVWYVFKIVRIPLASWFITRAAI